MAIMMGLVLILGIVIITRKGATKEELSEFGRYSGYSEDSFNGHARKSDFLILSDGTKLAYDLLLPTSNGVVEKNPLPVLFCYSTYLRAFNMVRDGKVINNEIMNLSVGRRSYIWLRARFQKDGNIFDYAIINKWVKRMLENGYAVIIVEQRGTGASEGAVDPSLWTMSKDANEVLNWISEQEWSDGKIGMFGKSSLAISQYAAAAANNPHLKAIFPISSSFDMYEGIIYPGGILNLSFTNVFELSTKMLEDMIVPVYNEMEPRDKTESFSNIMTRTFKESSYRNYNEVIWKDLNLYTMIDEINKSGVAIYNGTGWGDIFTRGAILWHNNLTVPRKMYISNEDHFALGFNETEGVDLGAEAHRWFDHWLKGIDNGIMEESSIHYFLIGEGWRRAEEFPRANSEKRRFYFDSDFQRKGLLTEAKPQSEQFYDLYMADYTTTSGKKSRWNSVIEPSDYANLTLNESNALVYTSFAFEEDMELVGHPVVNIFISTESSDLDFFVYLVLIDVEGKLTYLTEGHLRASHRKAGKAPFNNLELPYQRGFREDMLPLTSGKSTELLFDLLPIARRIKKGSRIRVIIALADYHNFDTPILDPAPEIKVLRNSKHASFIDMPIFPYNKGDSFKF